MGLYKEVGDKLFIEEMVGVMKYLDGISVVSTDNGYAVRYELNGKFLEYSLGIDSVFYKNTDHTGLNELADGLLELNLEKLKNQTLVINQSVIETVPQTACSKLRDLLHNIFIERDTYVSMSYGLKDVISYKDFTEIDFELLDKVGIDDMYYINVAENNDSWDDEFIRSLQNLFDDEVYQLQVDVVDNVKGGHYKVFSFTGLYVIKNNTAHVLSITGDNRSKLNRFKILKNLIKINHLPHSIVRGYEFSEEQILNLSGFWKFNPTDLSMGNFLTAVSDERIHADLVLYNSANLYHNGFKTYPIINFVNVFKNLIKNGIPKLEDFTVMSVGREVVSYVMDVSIHDDIYTCRFFEYKGVVHFLTVSGKLTEENFWIKAKLSNREVFLKLHNDFN